MTFQQVAITIFVAWGVVVVAFNVWWWTSWIRGWRRLWRARPGEKGHTLVQSRPQDNHPVSTACRFERTFAIYAGDALWDVYMVMDPSFANRKSCIDVEPHAVHISNPQEGYSFHRAEVTVIHARYARLHVIRFVHDVKEYPYMVALVNLWTRHTLSLLSALADRGFAIQTNLALPGIDDMQVRQET